MYVYLYRVILRLIIEYFMYVVYDYIIPMYITTRLIKILLYKNREYMHISVELYIINYPCVYLSASIY